MWGTTAVCRVSRAPLGIQGSAGSNTLRVNDSSDTTGRTVTLSNNEGVGIFGLITGLAPALISYEYANTRELLLTAGTGSNTISVQATGVPVVISDGGSGVVNVGNAGSVQGILAQLTFDGYSGADSVHINDSADPTPKIVNMGDSFGQTTYGVISGNRAGLDLLQIRLYQRRHRRDWHWGRHGQCLLDVRTDVRRRQPERHGQRGEQRQRAGNHGGAFPSRAARRRRRSPSTTTQTPRRGRPLSASSTCTVNRTRLA